MNPIGVGFLDLNPEGLFHLERMRLRPDFRCLAGWGCGPDRSMAHGMLERVALSPQELLDDPRISLLWIGPQADSKLMGSAQDAGKQVLIGLPVSTPLSVWKSSISPRASGLAAQLFVATLHRWDSSFLTVQQLVRNGELGPMIDVRRISRQYVPVERALNPAATCNSGEDGVALPVLQEAHRVQQIKWFEMLDELLQLVPDPVVSVFSQAVGTGRCVSLEFATGCRAWLELNRHSLAPLETGWVLDGRLAGFSAGKRFRPSTDHELIDVPVEELPTDQVAFYDALVATIRNGDRGASAVTHESIQRVLELLESMEQSNLTGQTVIVRI